MSYWEERFEKIKDDGMKEAEAFNEKMRKRYLRVMQILKRDVEAWYQRYATENGVSLADARKQLRAKELKAFKLTLEEYAKLAKEENLSDELKKMLDNASIRARLTRAEEIYISIAVRVEQTLTSVRDGKKLLSDVMEDSYYRSLYEMQRSTEYTPVARLPDNAIDTVLSNPWATDGKIFSERIWGNQQHLIATLQTELSQSLMLQEGGAPLVGRMMSRFDVSFRQARRLIETETAYVQEKAFMDSMERLGVEQYQILATLDNRTTPICRRLDKRIFDRKDAKPGVTMPPFHCYCRTTTVPYIPGISDDEGQTRAARKDGEPDGKTVQVPAELSYEEWYNEYVKSSTKYKLQQVMKEKRINGQLIMNPKPLNLDGYSFDEDHINKERSHNVTREQAISYMKNAEFALSRWDGTFMNYHSLEGAVYIDLKGKKIRTAYPKEDFDSRIKAMMEVFEDGK